MSADCPYRWTGMIAFVRGRDGGLQKIRIQAAVFLDRQSTKRKAAPVCEMASVVAMNV